MSQSYENREADERVAPLAFLTIAGVVVWIFAAILVIFFVRG